MGDERVQVPALRWPETRLESMKNWTDLDEGPRRRRAMAALRDRDVDELRSLLHAHLLAFRGLRTSEHTQTAYEYALAALLDFCKANGKRPDQLGKDDGRGLVRSLEAEYAPATVQQRLAGFRAIIRALEWTGVQTKNPFPPELKVADKTPPREKVKFYTRDELARLLTEADPLERAIVLLGADEGLRVAEMAALKWRNVDFQRRTLTVVGKGRKMARVVLTARCAGALRTYAGSSGPRRRAGADVFDVTASRIQQIVRTLCRRAKVSPLGVHALRHSCGTRLYEVTRDLKIVARHLRHADISSAAVYAHLADSDYREAVAQLEAANGKGTGKPESVT